MYKIGDLVKVKLTKTTLAGLPELTPFHNSVARVYAVSTDDIHLYGLELRGLKNHFAKDEVFPCVKLRRKNVCQIK